MTPRGVASIQADVQASAGGAGFVSRAVLIAAINGLGFDRHAEALAVESFSRAIILAAQRFMEKPTGTPLIPNWNRVTAAVPSVLEMMFAAVEGRRG